MVICLEQGANDLHKVYCHLIASCSIKIQIGFIFIVPAYPGVSGKRDR